METWGITTPKKERDTTENPFDKFSKPKKINRPYEYRKRISELVNKPLLQVFGQTKGFTEEQLNGIIVDAENDAVKFKINAGARTWNLIRELQKKIKTNKHVNTKI